MTTNDTLSENTSLWQLPRCQVALKRGRQSGFTDLLPNGDLILLTNSLEDSRKLWLSQMTWKYLGLWFVLGASPGMNVLASWRPSNEESDPITTSSDTRSDCWGHLSRGNRRWPEGSISSFLHDFVDFLHQKLPFSTVHKDVYFVRTHFDGFPAKIVLMFCLAVGWEIIPSKNNNLMEMWVVTTSN